MKFNFGSARAQIKTDSAAKAEVVDLIYPVGSIYMSVSSTSPATLFGGTWVQLEDRFLIGASSTYTAGGTGGASTHTLTTNEMPSHSHGMNSHTHTYTYPTGSTGGNNGNTGSTTINFSNGHGMFTDFASGFCGNYENTSTSWNENFRFNATKVSTTSGAHTWGMKLFGSQAHTHTLNSHTHTVNTGSTNTGQASGDTGSSGGGNSFSMLPPYLSVYMWKRTA